MTLRQFLQIELWSRERSRRILRSIWRIAKPVGLIFGVLVLLMGAVFVGEWYWLTGGERVSGRMALANLEELERLEVSASDGFDAMNREAQDSTAVAQARAQTLRDRSIANMLEIYRSELNFEHENRIRELEVRAIFERNHKEWPRHQDHEKESRNIQAQIYSSLRLALHKQLD